MGVALQAGVLAGGVVFVPMALAGWHLTRNRVLFFSAALFIVLAVSVHLLPYFPTMSSLLHSIHSPWPYTLTVVDSTVPSSPMVVSPPVNCLLHLHDLVWEDSAADQISGVPSSSSREFHWSRAGITSRMCRYQKLRSRDMVDLFRGTWIVVAGDSQLRFFFLSLLDLLMGPDANPGRLDPPQKHASYDYVWEEENIKFQFKWTPFTRNLTDLVVDYRRNLTYPDVLIMGGGLWHMLYSSNSTRYGLSLAKLKRALISLFPTPSSTFSSSTSPFGSESHSHSQFQSQPFSRAGPDRGSSGGSGSSGSIGSSSSGGGSWSTRDSVEVPHMFWLNLPTLVTSWLSTEMKRSRMTPETCREYDQALAESRLVSDPRGRGLGVGGGVRGGVGGGGALPITLIDLNKISEGCGRVCTADGMHYNNATYEAAVHIMVNALLIASHQSPGA